MQCMSSRHEQQAGAAGRSRGRSGGNVAGGRGGGEPAQLISQLVPTLTTPPAPATSPFCHPQATRRCTWRRATCTPTPSLRCSREGQTRSRRTARGAGGCCPGGGLSTGGCAQISRTACCRVPPARLTTLTFTPPLVQRRMALENVIQLLTGGCRACGALMSGSLGSGNDPACCFYDAIACSAGGYFLCNRRLGSLLPPSFLSTACLSTPACLQSTCLRMWTRWLCWRSGWPGRRGAATPSGWSSLRTRRR